MPKRIDLTNGRSWSTQTEALKHFKAMLSRYKDEAVVEDGDDHDDLVALLERYDSAIADTPTKTGVGIELFLRRKNVGDTFATSSFWVRRTDGSETDFSYISGVKGEPKAPSQEFCDACRGAIAPDTLAAKQKYFQKYADEQGRAPCDISDELITFDEAHVDHAWPTFNQLVQTFRADRGWTHDIPANTLTPAADAQTATKFTDDKVTREFREFHRREAQLRVVSKRENLRRGRGTRKPTVQRPITIDSV